MSTNIQPVRGTKDLFGQELIRFNYVIEQAKKAAALFGFEEFYTPIIEFSKVFKKTLGEDSDIVGKEMYTFLDRSGEELTLRPEFTAGVVRAFISNGLQQNLPLRLFSYGPLFRYERPQKGRQRQFHQINFELIGLDNPLFDVEIISLVQHILKNLGIWEDVTLNINSLATKEDRLKYRSALVEYFEGYVRDLSEDSKRRLKTNPLRILDSKDDNDQKISANAPVLSDYYSEESRDYFSQVLSLLDNLGISYVINPRLVRGLDYYDHTIFEFVTDKLGAQGTVLGGGRYNNMISMMGGPDTKAIGFGAGIERLMELVNLAVPEYYDFVTIVKIGNIDNVIISRIAAMLRDNNIKTIIAHQDNPAKQFKYASKVRSRCCVVIGEEELASKTVKIKDMAFGKEITVSLDNMIENVHTVLLSSFES